MTPDRDREMDRLMGAVLPGTLAPASAECLDAEQLAAWAEGALDPQEAHSVETHLAGCARCQALAAVFARSEPVPAASATPAVVIPMRRRWPMGWIAPLAAAAAAVTLWVVWPGRQTPTSSIATSPPPVAAPSQTMARAEDKQKAAETAPSAGAFAEQKSQNSALTRDRQAPADAARLDQLKKDEAATAKRDPNARFAEPVDSGPLPAPTVPAPVRGEASLPRTVQGGQLAPPPPAAAPRAQTGQAAGAAAPVTVGGVSESVQVRAEPALAQSSVAKLEAIVLPVIEIVTTPPDPQGQGQQGQTGQVVDRVGQGTQEPRNPAGAAGAGRGGGGGRGGGARAVPPAPASPPPAAFRQSVAPRWRILEGTRVERSTDNGATWLPLGIDLPGRLTGGASPATSVCWLIGERGLVLLSTNGLNFERVSSPAAVNLTGIRATSAQSATITTADGRTFVTSDGGQSWRLQGFPTGSF